VIFFVPGIKSTKKLSNSACFEYKNRPMDDFYIL
jgi:hypothetical protein